MIMMYKFTKTKERPRAGDKHSKIQSTHDSSLIVRSYANIVSSKASEFCSLDLSMIGSTCRLGASRVGLCLKHVPVHVDVVDRGRLPLAMISFCEMIMNFCSAAQSSAQGCCIWATF